MSQQLINLSPDLKRLRDEGYAVEVRAGYLVLRDVPYVNSSRAIQCGTIVSELTLANDVTVRPKTHVVLFHGDYPCDALGKPMEAIKHRSARKELGEGLIVDHSFSSKPRGGYADYYDKMTTYANILMSPALQLDQTVTARNFKPVPADAEDSVFQYLDTASSRAEITAVSDKLKLGSVAIVGLGGTGSYVLDLVAKTPVKEILLFDGDTFLQHNAFRSPGAPSLDVLGEAMPKVAYLQAVYSRMHRNIRSNACKIDQTNVGQLDRADFVFLCVDRGSVKRLIIDRLEERKIPFVDVGMGVNVIDGKLVGVLRVTTSTEERRNHVRERGRIPLVDSVDDDYATNIQVADLNALNAALAVIKWKKLFGFYADLEQEHHSTYTIDGNTLTNEEKP